MGLTIHYNFKSAASCDDDARQLIQRLRHRARRLPFQHIGDLLDLEGVECDYIRRDRQDPRRWLLVQAAQFIESEGCAYTAPPVRLLAFTTMPGAGCEAANFGLCNYPEFVDDGAGKRIKTGLASGWSWRSFCKTQYASNPQLGGVENFLKCHVGIIRLLDEAKDLNILNEVTDEGGYWRKRDARALVEQVAEWNAAIAGFVGGLKDLVGGGTDVRTEITKFPNYEHLEAEGRADEGQTDEQ
jgi:hypothetical protein